MVLMVTPDANIGFKAPDFNLVGTDEKQYTLSSVKGENGLLVMFICNHCPYVKAILTRLVKEVAALKEIGIGAIAIMSNDSEAYPEDGFENMKLVSKSNQFHFPYVIDESQSIAKAYGAICTPDFFGFDRNLILQYRGRLDGLGKEPQSDMAAGHQRELFHAMQEIATIDRCTSKQHPSMGCSIKWRG